MSDPAPVNPAPDPRRFSAADVDRLTYGELTAALYRADLSDDGPLPTLDQARRLVCQGVHRVGWEAIRQLDRQTRQLNLEMIRRAQRGEDTSQWTDRMRQLWPSRRRMIVARHVAHVLLAHRNRPIR